MAWWDYGYQINGMANRTTIADGNTWNHEHIALLGKVLVSSTAEGHKLAKHLADYVLVWSTRFGGMQVGESEREKELVRVGCRTHCRCGERLPRKRRLSLTLLFPSLALALLESRVCLVLISSRPLFFFACRATTSLSRRTWRASAARSIPTCTPTRSTKPKPARAP
jgi:hypothetical protein